MRFRTHFIFGLLVGLFFVELFKVSYFWILLVLMFALIPDIDEYRSKVGKKVIILSFIIKLLFKHRGLVHSFIIPLGLWFALFLFGYSLLGLAIVFGYGSHLVLDMLNISGIMLFYPFSKFKVKGFVKTGSIMENLIFVLIIIGIFFVIL